ncbi:amidohydrolase [Halalkalibacillus halophilus]|uniref:amidohydrolase n=1 Tax=Halalkalibacillus halophilus TaxID=392827 RepID=UPI0003FBCFAD|nr:amidohydrolase [Halalkalibacillus halophilus]
MKYDLIIHNGTILTIDEQKIAKAVAVNDGKIAQVWTSSFDINKENADQHYDLNGQTLIPGFIDTHNHILMYAKMKKQIYCGNPPHQNVEELLTTIRTQADETEPGEWIIGWGYDDTMLEEQRHIIRDEIDTVAPDHPVFIRHISGHLAVVNSKALDQCGIEDSVQDPSGGHFGRTADGKLDGVLYELPILEMVMKHFKPIEKNELNDLMVEAAEDYIREGITTNTDAAVGLDGGYQEFKEHMNAVTDGRFTLKMRYMVMDAVLNDAPFKDMTAEEVNAYIIDQSKGQGRFDSAKFFQDGSIQGYTGALRGGYHLDPEHNGALIHEQVDLDQMFLKAHKRGFRIACHGNGDLAIESIISSLTKALDEVPRNHHLHRVEHLQTAREEDLNRMQAYDIATSLFINHVYYWGDRHRNIFLGPERAQKLDPLQSVKDKGLLYTLHSDNPITPISPLFSIWAAVNRRTKDGHVLGEEERISVEEALKTMTIYGAKLNNTEDENGSIKIGKAADFAVLSDHPFEIDPIELKNIQVVETFISGKKQLN